MPFLVTNCFSSHFLQIHFDESSCNISVVQFGSVTWTNSDLVVPLARAGGAGFLRASAEAR